jgi:hypothetical protein
MLTRAMPRASRRWSRKHTHQQGETESHTAKHKRKARTAQRVGSVARPRREIATKRKETFFSAIAKKGLPPILSFA